MTQTMRPPFTPGEFEDAVAEDYRGRGYTVERRGGTNDWGIDVVARRGKVSLAIQAKMYGGARPVNRRQIFELYGAAKYFDHTGAVIATDSYLAADAAGAATKLGIEVWRPADRKQFPSAPRVAHAVGGESGRLPTFDEIWENDVMPLASTTLTRASGSSNRILKVDWAGITRLTSGGRHQWIPIEPFRWAIERVREQGSVTRDEINQQYEGRASSGIVLVLAQVPALEVSGRPLTVRSR